MASFWNGFGELGRTLQANVTFQLTLALIESTFLARISQPSKDDSKIVRIGACRDCYRSNSLGARFFAVKVWFEVKVCFYQCRPGFGIKLFTKENPRMTFAWIILTNLAIVLVAMSCLWIVSVVVKDSSIVDPCWGLGFVVIAWSTIWQTGWQDLRDGLLVVLVTLWGLRLSGYLYLRNHNKGEDRRYAAMRHKHGSSFWWVSFLTVFMLQAVLMWFISLTFQSGMFHSGLSEIGFVGGLGVVVWVVGFAFESIGDFQMAQFKSNPDNAGKVMNRGLWRYTRHPNYFGDFCVWWGLFLIAFNAHSWWTFVCPALMSFFLMKVSGVAMLESDIADRRPDYDAYKKTTIAFFPMPVSRQSE